MTPSLTHPSSPEPTRLINERVNSMAEEKGSPPTAMLRHAKPGQLVVLKHDSKPRVLLKTDRWYGYFDGMKASLCHPVHPAFMVFGDGQGWHVKEQP